MTFQGNIIDRPDTFTAFITSHGYGIAACIIIAAACAIVYTHWGA